MPKSILELNLTDNFSSWNENSYDSNSLNSCPRNCNCQAAPSSLLPAFLPSFPPCLPPVPMMMRRCARTDAENPLI